MASIKDIQKALAKADLEVSKGYALIEGALGEIESLAEEQQESADNFPESLVGTERHQVSVDRADKLEEIRALLQDSLAMLDDIGWEIE
jgi:hypothetical protein